MQDEQINHIIRDAAEKHHPPYDDKAWLHMKQLLDKHLPEQEPKKRFPFLWLLLLLFVGSAVFLVMKFQKSSPETAFIPTVANKRPLKTTPGNNPVVAGSTEPPIAAPVIASNQIIPANGKSIGHDQSSPNIQSVPAINGGDTYGEYSKAGNNKQVKPAAHIHHISNSKSRMNIKPGATSNEGETYAEIPGNILEDGSNKTNTAQPNIKGDDGEKEKKSGNSEEENNKKNIAAVNKQDTTQQVTKKILPANEPVATASSKKKTVQKGFGQNFSLLLSAGTDLSFIRINKVGKATLLYGAGLGYTIKRLTVRSGFYVSDKIYTAAKDDYYIDPAAPLYFRGELQHIDADCKVYEIPVSLSYSFGKKKDHNWLAGAGISSLLMKRETYNYFWKTPAGVMMNRPYTYNNTNKHYFSVLTLSGGYQYALGKKLFILAEPYLKLPLTGIGAGKIKLNSGGVLLTLGVKPFAKKK